MADAQKKTPGVAIASLVCGCLFFFFPSSIAAVVLGIIALVQISKNPNELDGKGLAIAGLVLGTVGLVLMPILAIVAGAVMQTLKSGVKP